jgi:CheY-like chemotaxis protein
MAKQILLVEDNEHLRQVLARFLNILGYVVAEAATGLEAVHLASTLHPDLIVMDLGLPEITGDEATARIKANSTTRDIPVVVVTAWTVGERTERVLEAGAAEVLYKPVDLSTLRDALDRYLGSTRETGGAVAA